MDNCLKLRCPLCTYFMFTGCEEVVTWIVFEKSLWIKQQQVFLRTLLYLMLVYPDRFSFKIYMQTIFVFLLFSLTHSRIQESLTTTDLPLVPNAAFMLKLVITTQCNWSTATFLYIGNRWRSIMQMTRLSHHQWSQMPLHQWPLHQISKHQCHPYN